MHKIHLPRLGQMMESGTVMSWLKQEGDSFEIDEPLYEVETEKAQVEVTATLPGTLARIVVPPGEEVPVGTLLAIVADPGETLDEQAIKTAIAEDSEGAQDGEGEPAPAATAVHHRPETPKVRAVPRARALAEERGIDLSTIDGSGPGGSITVRDVERATAAMTAAASPGPRVRERRQLRGVPKSMADVLARSWQQCPQMVLNVSVDATALVQRRAAARERVRQEVGVDLTFSDLIHAAVVAAVPEVPEVNASFQDDAIVLYEDVNLSVAVASDAGLVAPVIHRAQDLSLADLARRRGVVAERARTGTLTIEDVEGGTITVSNLGMFGIESATPLVTLPQAVIVFVGAMIDEPVVRDGSIGVRPVIRLSVACDHRVLDGATAARFVTALKRNLEAS